jgi:hypothetical protein
LAPRRYNTETVSPDVLAQMKRAMQESSHNAASHSFLLDDDSAIPFGQADVERMVDDKASVCVEGGQFGGWMGRRVGVQIRGAGPAGRCRP